MTKKPRILSPQAQEIMRMIEADIPPEEIKLKVKDYNKYATEAYKAHKRKLAQLDGEGAKVRSRSEIEADIVARLHKIGNDWMTQPIVLQGNNQSALHRLIEFIAQRPEVIPGVNELLQLATPFLVQRDWTKLIAQAFEEQSTSIVLPYDVCAFEFVISGKRVILVAQQTTTLEIGGFVELQDYWLYFNEEDIREYKHFKFAYNQVLALCIALEAQVIETSVQRAPIALNKKREAQGKPRLRDFHIVDLHRRYKTKGPGSGMERRSPRLHFRRGHWRHYPEYKVRVPWTLVGDPDLGFVDKVYKS